MPDLIEKLENFDQRWKAFSSPRSALNAEEVIIVYTYHRSRLRGRVDDGSAVVRVKAPAFDTRPFGIVPEHFAAVRHPAHTSPF